MSGKTGNLLAANAIGKLPVPPGTDPTTYHPFSSLNTLLHAVFSQSANPDSRAEKLSSMRFLGKETMKSEF
jgi:hypothetical protein